ncbi:MAG: leucine-rich repeat protein, partial [Clostridia bacterium]|nr:leucine-rich repeat protein [Clostridia bacterium]
AFSGCSSLRSIEIPSSVTSIGNSAFDNCDKEKLVFYVEKDSYADTWAKDNGWNTSYDTFKDNSYSISSTFIYLDKGTQTEPYKMLVDTEGTIDAVIKTKSDDTAVTINWSSDNTDVIVFTESSNDKGYHILMPVDNPSLNEYYSASGVKFKGKSEGSAVITATAEGWSKSWSIQVVGSDEEIPNKEYYNVEEEEEDLSQLSPEERLLKYSMKYRKSVEDVNDDITRKLKQIKKKNEQNEEKAFKEMLPKIRNMYSENLMLTDDEVYAVEKGIFYYFNTMVNEGEDISGLDLSKNETEIGVNLVKKVYNNLSKDKKTYTIDKYKITISVDISLFGAFSGNISITDTTNPDKYYSPLLFNSDIDTSVAAMRAYCEQLRTLTKNALNYGVNSYIDYFTSSTGLDKFIEDTFKTITLSAFLEEEGFVEAANILLDGYEIYTEVEEVIEKGGLVDSSVLESLKDKGVGDISANDLVNTTYKKLASMRKNVVAAAIDCYEGTNTPSDDPVEKISFFKKLTIKCPVDVYIYDSEGNEIGSIVENVVTEGADNIKINVENGAKYVYVLDNTDISCKTVGYDYGVLNVTEEQGCNGNIIGREIYYNIPVYPNDVFTKKVDGDSYGTEGNSIYRNGEEITPSECIEATENGAVAIDVTAENGSVDGSGIYVKGNPVALMASADSGYYFAGWYKGDKLVSATSIYKFTAREDVGLEARFEKITDNSGESIGVRANRIDGTSSIVFVSSVDSLDYEEVGFRFEANGRVVERSTDTVYSAIENSKYTLSETGGSYMYGFTITDIADKEAEIRVTPYVVTVDGEKILGEEYVCSLNSLSEATVGLNTDSIISVDKEERLYIREDIINEEKIY